MKTKHVWTVAVALLSAPVVADDSFFAPVDRLWSWPPETVIEIYEGDSTEMEDCLIFIFDGPTTTARQESPSGGVKFVPTGYWERPNRLVSWDNLLVCEIRQHPQIPWLLMLYENNQPLYMSAGPRALDALTDAVVPSALKNGGWPWVIANYLLYDFDDGQVFAGFADEVPPLASATVNFEKAHGD